MQKEVQILHVRLRYAVLQRVWVAGTRYGQKPEFLHKVGLCVASHQAKGKTGIKTADSILHIDNYAHLLLMRSFQWLEMTLTHYRSLKTLCYTVRLVNYLQLFSCSELIRLRVRLSCHARLVHISSHMYLPAARPKWRATRFCGLVPARDWRNRAVAHWRARLMLRFSQSAFKSRTPGQQCTTK